ncbi:MAG: cbb3-type cytochrome c oxidase subunit 3 [Rhodobacterales bacterium]|nr:cbb3-type cytochrome c oxidase subunit 3 [Rhodobacterales bacterium]
MERYTFLRAFADSWMLIVLFAFFVGVCFWVFRRGSKKSYDEQSKIPFRHEDKPAPPRADDPSEEE